MKKKKVLFICTGNYYRSRFSEILFNLLASKENLPWESFSRGFAAGSCDENTGAISPHAIKGLKKLGIELGKEIPFPNKLIEDDLNEASIIIALKDDEHRTFVKEKFPMWEPKIVFWKIHDIDCATPDEALPELENNVRKLILDLRQEKI